MRRSPTTSKMLVALLHVGIVSSLGFGPFSTAVEKVREGISHFTRGEFEAAGKAFTEADVAEPENFRIAFDRACALAAPEIAAPASISAPATAIIRSARSDRPTLSLTTARTSTLPTPAGRSSPSPGSSCRRDRPARRR